MNSGWGGGGRPPLNCIRLYLNPASRHALEALKKNCAHHFGCDEGISDGQAPAADGSHRAGVKSRGDGVE